MKLLYIANQRIPTEKAYGLQITKMCQAFAGLGLEIELLVPTRRNPIKKDIFDYYSVGRTFKFKKVFAPDFYLPGKLDLIAFWIKNLFSGLVLFMFALGSKVDIIFSRDELPIYFLSFFKSNLVYEAHRYSKAKKVFYRRFKNAGVKIVTISQGLTKAFLQEGFSQNELLTSPDGVDLEEFSLGISQEEARKKTSLPLDKKIILYSGQLFEWKGAASLLEVARNFQFSIFPDGEAIEDPRQSRDNFQNNLKDVLFVFVGGMPTDIENFRKKAEGLKNVLLLGQRPHKEIPYFLKSADVLVLPNKKDGQISEFYTSPLKLFEYMAAERPIVASDLPSLREILNENNSVLVKPDNASALADGLKLVLSDDALADRISQKAFEDVQKYSWQERAQKIINFIKIS